MNREFLKGLGLTDDQIDKAMAEHGKTVNKAKDDLAAVTTERDDLKGQLGDRDKQLSDLGKKVKDNEDLTAEIDRLKGENATQAFNFSLEKALTNAKVRNPKAVKALLDTEAIKLDGDKLLNLDSQLEALKASDAYLFEAEEAAPPPNTPNFVAPGNPNGGNTSLTKGQIMQEKDNIKRQELIKQNSHLFK